MKYHKLKYCIFEIIIDNASNNNTFFQKIIEHFKIYDQIIFHTSNYDIAQNKKNDSCVLFDVCDSIEFRRFDKRHSNQIYIRTISKNLKSKC